MDETAKNEALVPNMFTRAMGMGILNFFFRSSVCSLVSAAVITAEQLNWNYEVRATGKLCDKPQHIRSI